MTDAVVPTTRRPWKFVRGVVLFFNAIGPTTYGELTEAKVAPNLGVISLLCLDAAIALLMIAFGQGAGRRFEPTLGSLLVWGGVATLVIPFIVRLTRPNVARGERLFLLLVLGESLYLYSRFYSPARFAGYDEFLHWVTAYDILHRHELFLTNTLLPVSPFYPALEIVTSAYGSLANVDVFPAGVIFIGILRAIFISSLFLFIERITAGASRIAVIACVIYMSASTFVVFHAIYSYESMGVALVAFMMWWETRVSNSSFFDFRIIIPALMVLASLAVTHHASAMVCFSYIIVVMVIEAMRRGITIAKLATLAGVAVITFGFVFAWEYMPFNPVRDYLTTAFARELQALIHVLNGEREARVPFVAVGGQTQPFWSRFTAISGVLLISLSLATGFFRSLTWKSPYKGLWRFLSLWRREWGDSRIVLLTIGAIGFPVAMVFRLSAGWEIGDRMGSWVFISVGLVVSMGLVYYWESLSWWRRSCTNFVVTFIVMGGLIIGVGPHPINGHFEVNSDEASIEPMGIDTASWVKEWLGQGNNFAADRVNQLLLATYGQQNVITNIRTSRTPIGNDVSYIFLDKTIDKNALVALQRSRIQYLEVDLRNSTNRPVLGAFFSMDEANGSKPMNVASLLKFDKRPEVSRIYDNGYLIIYNVGRIQRADE